MKKKNILPWLPFILLVILLTVVIRFSSSNPVLLFQNISPEILNLAFGLLLLTMLGVYFLDQKNKSDDRFPGLFLLGAGLFFAFLLFHSLYYSVIYDDAYISYRYVHNLLSGHGLVFNPGERVEAYSNLLWIIMIAALQIVFRVVRIDIPLTSIFLSFAAVILIIFGLKKYFRALNMPHGLYYYLPLLAVNSFFAFWLFGGIETAAFAALLVLAVSFYQSEETRHLPWIWALLILLRADGFVYYGIFILSMLVSHVSRQKLDFVNLKKFLSENRNLFIFPLATLLGLVGFRLAYYGFPLPNTFYAKVGSPFAAKITTGWEYIWEFLDLTGFVFILLLVLFIFLEKKITGRRLISPFIILTAMYFVYLGGDSLIHYRFMTHIIPLLLLAPVLLIEFLARELKAKNLKLAYLLLAGYFFFLGNHNLYISYKYQFKGWYPLQQKRQQYEQMYQLGKYFNKKYTTQTLALGAIGIIPYVARDMRIIDILGLADRHIAHLRQDKTDFHIGHNKWDMAYVLSASPSIIIPPNYIFTRYPAASDLADNDFLYGKDLFAIPEFLLNYQPKVREINGVHYLYYQKK